MLRGLSDAEKRAYVLADNKIAELAGYDQSALADELSNLSAALISEGLDLNLTGFEIGEIDALIANFADPPGGPDDVDRPVKMPSRPVTRRGDVWLLGRKHRLICGDARHISYTEIMKGECAAMLLADAPYNLNVAKVGGRGRTKHRNFCMASGEMSPDEFTTFLVDAFSPAVPHLAKGALCYIFMDWRHQREALDAGERVFGGELKALIVWVKTNPGQGSFYRSQHELIYVFKNGEVPHVNNVELGRFGRNRSNVWTYPGVNSFGSGRMANLVAHPTSKPVQLVADAIRDCTRRSDIILDPFTGAGTTILAAERVGRRGFGVEIDPLYVDTAIRRWITTYKSDVVLEGSMQTFEDVAADRAEVTS